MLILNSYGSYSNVYALKELRNWKLGKKYMEEKQNSLFPQIHVIKSLKID